MKKRTWCLDEGNMITPDGKTGMGWITDYLDIRDYPDTQQDVKKLLSPTVVRKVKRSLQPKIDLNQCCSPVENQLSIGSCTAHAGAGEVEYYEKGPLEIHFIISYQIG